jgi:hypothetical protein
MIDAPSIDYKVAFEELNTLNSLFSRYHGINLPTLNPSQFRVEDDGVATRDVVIHGIQTGLYYLSLRRSDSTMGFRYSAFVVVTPTERTVIDWIKA